MVFCSNSFLILTLIRLAVISLQVYLSYLMIQCVLMTFYFSNGRLTYYTITCVATCQTHLSHIR